MLLWDINDDERIPKKARELICDPKNLIFYSTVSIWEVEIKHSKHPKTMGIGSDELTAYCAQAGFIPLEIKDSHVNCLKTLRITPGMQSHGDPFDRILIAQAKCENMLLVTHDKGLACYNEVCVEIV